MLLSCQLFFQFYLYFLSFFSLFCKMAALVRHRISLFGKAGTVCTCLLVICLGIESVSADNNKKCPAITGSDSAIMVSCLHILSHSLDTRYTTSIYCQCENKALEMVFMKLKLFKRRTFLQNSDEIWRRVGQSRVQGLL